MIDILPQVYEHQERKARKAHRCCECHSMIQPGEHYHVHKGIWDGEPAEFKVCPECEQLRAEADQNLTDWEERTSFGGLLESIQNSSDLGLLRRFRENQAVRKEAKLRPAIKINENVLHIN